MKPHDVGGRAVDAPIPREQHAVMPWEVRVDAMMWLLSDPTRPGGQLMTVDELRHGIESLPAQDYERLGYYEKWLYSLVGAMIEKGIVEREEVEARVRACEESRP